MTEEHWMQIFAGIGGMAVGCLILLLPVFLEIAKDYLQNIKSKT